MKLGDAIDQGKLIDNVKVYRKYQMKSIDMSKYPSNVYKAMTVSEIKEVMEWYFLQLRKHIVSLNRKIFKLPGVGYIRVIEYRANLRKHIKAEDHEV